MSVSSKFGRRDIFRLGGAVTASALFSRVGFAATGSVEQVNVLTATSVLTQALLNMLATQGYEEKFGIKAKTTTVVDVSKVIPGLLGGENDISTMGGITLAFPAIERGAKLKVVAGNALIPALVVYAKNPTVKSVEDLVGRTIGTGAIGAVTQQLMVGLLKKHGIDSSKVTFRNIGGVSDIIKAVAAGTVDAGPSQLYGDLDRFGVHVLNGGKLWETFPDYVSQGSIASDVAIASKRDALVRILAAYGALFRFVQTPELREPFMKAYTDASGAPAGVDAQTMWQFIQDTAPNSYASNLVLSQDQIDVMQELNLETGMQKAKLPFSMVADTSIAEEARKLLDSQ